ncbi:hypothetical protein BKA57DRAFT_446761 [Linnemannia elongata]|nr:hypothetical protein BKA57DRAFT_446761 [Linnemannia elongata]
MSFVILSAEATQEVNLKIVSPLLNEDNKTTTIKTQTFTCNSYLHIYLTRKLKNMLKVQIQWFSQNHKDLTHYESMRVFPDSSASFVHFHSFASNKAAENGGRINCGCFPAKKVIKGDKYAFDLVLCTDHNLPRKLVPPPPPLPPPAPKNHDIIPLLLKDASSVDVCFTFTSDKVYSNLGLWAHRVVLARHKVFAKLIQQQEELQALVASMTKAENENENDKEAKFDSDAESTCTMSADGSPTTSSIAAAGDTRSLVIKVHKFSLATFCALLYYIYTDEVDLAIEANRFAISSNDSSLVLRDSATGKTRTVHPTGRSSPWKLKDVTWVELLEAADHYEISDLRANCLEKVISGMNQSNVVDVLFTTSISGVEVRQAAMEFIVKHWVDVFQKGKDGCGGVDPFAAYRGLEECHEVLIELMHMKAERA